MAKLQNKLSELEDIFDQTNNGMEWQEINLEAVQVIREENGLDKEPETLKKWLMKTNNFFLFGHKVISLAEGNAIMQEYTTLNDEFKKRLKDENRRTDEAEVGEKRPILDSPPPRNSKKDEEMKKKKG